MNEEFKKLHNRLNSTKFTNSNNNVKKEVERLHAYIDSQEKYYNSIPVSIRTNKTLDSIISRLSFNIDNLEKSLDPLTNKYKLLELAYINEQNLNHDPEIIYVDSDSTKQELLEFINKLNQKIILQNTEFKKTIDDYRKRLEIAYADLPLKKIIS